MNLSVAILFLSICLLFGLIAMGFGRLTDRISDDEHSTCKIQAQGLPAGHELAVAMRDIHILLTLKPESEAQKLAALNMPADVKIILADLNMHLALYQTYESMQPQTRQC
jgi:hypothetical protein